MPTDKILFAEDRSLRTIDQDGRMHVQVSNISKSIVNPYRGSEIPDSDRLGLLPDKIYYLLRDPAELEKAASSFNNIPILNRHIPVFADAPQKDVVVGSTGTDAVFSEPYLSNSLVIWDSAAIAGINSRHQCELSSAYRYDADMTPGAYAGVSYDGIMRNIKGNHVALVEVGRAGPDVVVGDSKLKEVATMKKKLSAHAVAVGAMLTQHLTPKLATDAKLSDFAPVLLGVTSANFDKRKQAIVDGVKAACAGKMANDADLDDIMELLDSLGDDDEVAEDAAKPCPTCGHSAAPALDEFPPKPKEDDKTVDKPAMDAAIAAAVADTEKKTVARMQAVRTAETEVAPLIGVIAAMDSAESVYKLALDAAKVDTTDVHPSAFRAMVGMLVKTKSVVTVPAVKFAVDSESITDFNTRYPNATKMKGGA